MVLGIIGAIGGFFILNKIGDGIESIGLKMMELSDLPGDAIRKNQVEKRHEKEKLYKENYNKTTDRVREKYGK